MSVEFVEYLSEHELNEFVQQSSCKSIYQMSYWAQVKKSWDHAYVGLKMNGKLEAAAMILFRHLGAGFYMAYITRGPVLDYTNADVIQTFFKEINMLR